MVRILPSIASADQLCIADEMKRIEGTGYLHIDIEDGNFLPNITFGMKTVKAVCEGRRFEYDAHLLVTNPERYLDELHQCGVSKIAFHIEAAPYPLELLNRIRGYGMKAGLALNFKTPVQSVWPFIPALDYVLIMTSEPDGEGCRFYPRMLEKIAEARAMLPAGAELWVDGGIGKEELMKVLAAGADTAVMGRAIWGGGQPRERIREYMEIGEQWNRQEGEGRC